MSSGQLDSGLSNAVGEGSTESATYGAVGVSRMEAAVVVQGLDAESVGEGAMVSAMKG